MSTDIELVAWLLAKGSPVIRYRTTREIITDTDAIDTDPLAGELIRNQLVSLWLERLGTSTELTHLHSSKVTAYENAMGKLLQLGCQNGFAPFDEKTKIYRTWFGSPLISSGFDWTPFKRKVVGSFLVAAGYHQENAILEYLGHRLETLWRFTREKDFDIYTDRGQYPDIPKGFHDKPLVNPELYVGSEEYFPSIYDIYALANFPTHLLNENTQQKIDSVIEYVLDPKYQAFPEGYGLMRAAKRKYYAIGWSVHLPGYHFAKEKKRDENRLIQRLTLMSNFQMARKHRWFQENLSDLENYRTDRGTYLFPRSYLQERPSGYWVTGAYMGLEENRRKKIAIELEFTFWMLKIKSTVGLLDIS